MQSQPYSNIRESSSIIPQTLISMCVPGVVLIFTNFEQGMCSCSHLDMREFSSLISQILNRIYTVALI